MRLLTARRRGPVDMRPVIRVCGDEDFPAIYSIVNDGAKAYCGIIPADRWHEPYMSKVDLRKEIEAGVAFWAYEENGRLVGVMGIQDVQDVTLIRHAYVRTARRGQGIGTKLMKTLLARTKRPTLVGTWAAATWAVRFYESRGFRRVTEIEKDRVLRKYWTIPVRQIEESVVLGDAKWFQMTQGLVAQANSRPILNL